MKFDVTKLLSALLALVMLLAMWLLSGCGTLIPSRDAEPSFCDVARPLTWSAADSDETLRGIRAHNARGVELCGWGQ